LWKALELWWSGFGLVVDRWNEFQGPGAEDGRFELESPIIIFLERIFLGRLFLLMFIFVLSSSLVSRPALIASSSQSNR
jgi:hypothetical protein